MATAGEHRPARGAPNGARGVATPRARARGPARTREGWPPPTTASQPCRATAATAAGRVPGDGHAEVTPDEGERPGARDGGAGGRRAVHRSARAPSGGPAASPRRRHGAPSATSAGTTMANSENCRVAAYSVRRATFESGGSKGDEPTTTAATRHQPRQRGAPVTGPPGGSPGAHLVGRRWKKPQTITRKRTPRGWRTSAPG